MGGRGVEDVEGHFICLAPPITDGSVVAVSRSRPRSVMW